MANKNMLAMAGYGASYRRPEWVQERMHNAH